MDILIALADTLWTNEQYPREKLVPIIFHVGISLSFSWPQTVEIMNSIASVLEEVSPRAKYRPVLWLNPTASGHLKPPGVILNQGNEAIWAFGTEMEKEATKRSWDVLGMWNSTIQASSWDGTNYGESIFLVINEIVTAANNNFFFFLHRHERVYFASNDGMICIKITLKRRCCANYA